MDRMQSTRNKLIHLLANNESRFVSGQMLSEKLNISRSAVWKQMRNLEKAGYKIEAKPNQGYRILSYPDNISEYTLQWGLQTDWIGKRIIHKETTTTTQLDAHQLAQENCEHGTIVIADEQTKGKGRMNRPWHSSKKKGIWMSIILRPKIPPYRAPQLTLLTATVLAEVINDYIGIQPQIKWPNDILINGKKTAGILTEMQAEQDQIQYVVIGLGLNVNQLEQDLPNTIGYKATSLQIETSKQWNLRKIIQNFLTTFEKHYTSYIAEGFGKIKSKWENYGYKIGEPIWIITPQGSNQVIFLGIAEDGALLIKDKQDEVKSIYSAEIDWFKGDK